MTDFTTHTLATADDYVAQATAHLEAQLLSAITARGEATLLVSGGASPKPVYEALSQLNIGWDKVTISLVDERWVQEGADGSNASFIKDTLLQSFASAATFVSMVNTAPTAKGGEDAINARFEETFPNPIDVCVMGMGTDGHTASWFPKSTTLSHALDIDDARAVVWQDAAGQVGGSGFDDRITVTLPLVMRARNIVLLIPGDTKEKVWEASADKDIYEAPVTTLRAAGPRLDVFTHKKS